MERSDSNSPSRLRHDIFFPGIIVASHDATDLDQRLLYDSIGSPESIYFLDIKSQMLTKVVCQGDIPAPREDCSLSVIGKSAFLFGGRRIHRGPHQSQEIAFFELNLTSFKWSMIAGSSALENCPLNRSKHTATVYQKRWMIVYGGRCEEAGPSLGEVRRAVEMGFFDVSLFDTVTRRWVRICQGFPMVFDHCAALFRNRFLIVFGGLHFRLDTAADEQETTAEVECSNSIYVLDLEQDIPKWSQCISPQELMEPKEQNTSPSQQESKYRDCSVGPAPRFASRCTVLGNCFIMCGGFSIDSVGRLVCYRDCWVWGIRTGMWSKIEFCVANWDGAVPILLGDEVNGHLVVIPDLRTVYRCQAAALWTVIDPWQNNAGGNRRAEELGGWVADVGLIKERVYEYSPPQLMVTNIQTPSYQVVPESSKQRVPAEFSENASSIPVSQRSSKKRDSSSNSPKASPSPRQPANFSTVAPSLSQRVLETVARTNAAKPGDYLSMHYDDSFEVIAQLPTFRSASRN